MTSGLGGLGYTEDAVAAKLSLDLPNDSEQILKHIAEYSSEVRVNMEATSRYTGDYIQYLQSFPTIQRQVNDLQRDQLQILRDTASVTTSMRNQQGVGFQNYSDAGRSVPNSFYENHNSRPPPGYQNFHTPSVPLGNIGNEVNRQQSVGERAEARIGGSTQPILSPADAANLPTMFEPFFKGLYEGLEKYLRQQDSNAVNDPTHPRHGRPPAPPAPGGPSGGGPNGSPDENGSGPPRSGGSLDRSIRQGANTADSAVNDLQRVLAGGSNSSRLSALANLLGNAPNAMGQGGTGIAGLLSRLPGSGTGGGLIGNLPGYAKAAGVAGAAVAAGTVAFNAVQNTGETVQNLRNQDIHGHSLGGGFGIQKDIALMALNPLITNEQSRSIIMGALGTGATGQSYNSAVDFISKNLTDMNISVGDSIKLLRQNVDLGNQSIGSLGVALDKVKLAGTGLGNSLPDAQGGFISANTAGVESGLSAEDSSASGVFAANLFTGELSPGIANPLGVAQKDENGNITVEAPRDIILRLSIADRRFSIRAATLKGITTTDTFEIWQKIGPDQAKVVIEVWKEIANKDAKGDLTNFLLLMPKYGVPVDSLPNKQGDAQEFFRQLTQGKDKNGNVAPDPIATAAGKVIASNTYTANGKDIGTAQSFQDWASDPANKVSQVGQAFAADPQGTLDKLGPGVLNEVAPYVNQYNKSVYGTDGSNPKLDGNILGNIVKNQNPKKSLVIVDPQGKAHQIDPDSDEQKLGFANGSWHIVDSGQENIDSADRNDDGSIKWSTTVGDNLNPFAYNHSDAKINDLDVSKLKPLTSGPGWNQLNPGTGAASTDLSSGNGGGGSFDISGGGPGQSVVHVSAAPWLKRFFEFVPVPGNVTNDNHTNAANAGQSGATRNDGSTTLSRIISGFGGG